MAISFTGAPFPPELMLMGVRWSLASPLSTRPVAARMLERGCTWITRQCTGG